MDSVAVNGIRDIMAMLDLPDVLGMSASQERIISNNDSLDSTDHYQGIV